MRAHVGTGICKSHGVMKQRALSLIAEVRPGHEATVEETLRSIGASVRGGSDDSAFDRMRTVHFARWVLVPAQTGKRGDAYPAHVAFESNYDGAEDAHVRDLATVAEVWLDAIYQHCIGYPDVSERTTASRMAFLERKMTPYGAWHMGHPGLGVSVIRNDAEVRRIVQDHLDRVQRGGLAEDASAWEIVDSIRSALNDAMADNPALRVEPIDRELPSRKRFVAKGLLLAGVGLAALRAAPRPVAIGVVAGAIAAAAGAAARLRQLEERDEAATPPTPTALESTGHDHMRRLVMSEDEGVQNQITHLVEIREGRLWILNSIMWAIELLARNWYYDGKLGSIATIHFGRWVIIDGGKRLLFLSNYTGSWESYIGDFVDKTADWLTAVWSNTEDFPPTRWLFGRGARSEARFKQWTREKQIETQVWYGAYPELSLANVLDNAALREAISGRLEELEDIQALLRRL